MLDKKALMEKAKEKAGKLKNVATEETKKFIDHQISYETKTKAKKLYKEKIVKISSATEPKKEIQSSKTSEGKNETTSAELSSMIGRKDAPSQAPAPKKTSALTIQPLEQILQAALPNWNALNKTANTILTRTGSIGTVKWKESCLPIAKRHIKKGAKHDVWCTKDMVVLQSHPTFLERLLAQIASLFSVLLSPWYALKNILQKIVQSIAAKLGPIFAIFALPVAFLAFLGDIVTLFFDFLLSVPGLLLSPLTLVASFFALLVQFIGKFIARVIWAFLLPVIGRVLGSVKQDKTDKLQNALKKMPWLRYMVLGFFRNDRPASPVIIPAKTVSQVLIAKRGGIFNRGEYLLIVEGDKLVDGLMNRFWAWFKTLIFPFYWERSVHMIALSVDMNIKQQMIKIVESSLHRHAEKW